MYKNISYFSGLNALRFMAAMLVVLHHGEQIRMKYNLPNLKDHELFNLGGFAVTFFFVLSGFLITYLLLAERQKKGRISVGKFYMRRVLRIWPLYFLLVALGLFVVPMAIQAIGYDYVMPYDWQQVILYFVFFSPFMANILYGSSLLEPLWSIGVEEIFYLGWGPVMRWVKGNVLWLLLGVIAVKVALNGYIYLAGVSNIFSQVVGLLQFEALAIGGLGAWWLFGLRREVGSFPIFGWWGQVACLLLIGVDIVPWFDVWKVAVVWPVVVDIAFIYLIINVSVNSRSFLRLENRVLNFLGNISYGIYMYHMVVIFSVILVLGMFLGDLSLWSSTVVYYGVVVSLTVLVSGLSKRYFEDYFLSFKKGC